MYGYDQAQKVLQRFPIDEQNNATQRARQIFAYGMFTAVMKPFGDALATAGAKVYAYQFN